jgi:hypothetical protein
VPVSTGTRSLSSPEQVWMLLRARILIWVNRRAICPGCHSRANPTWSNHPSAVMPATPPPGFRFRSTQATVDDPPSREGDHDLAVGQA